MEHICDIDNYDIHKTRCNYLKFGDLIISIKNKNTPEAIYIEINSLSLLHTNENYGRDKQNQGSACGEEENQPLAGRPTGRYPINCIKVVHQLIPT